LRDTLSFACPRVARSVAATRPLFFLLPGAGNRSRIGSLVILVVAVAGLFLSASAAFAASAQSGQPAQYVQSAPAKPTQSAHPEQSAQSAHPTQPTQPTPSAQSESPAPVRAVVSEASELREVAQGYYVQHVRLRILEGKFAGQEVEIDNPVQTQLPEYRAFNRPLRAGDRVFVHVLGEHSVLDTYVLDYVRDVPLAAYAGLFAFVLVILGGQKGLRSFLALAAGIFVFLAILVPLLASGRPPLATSLLVGGGYATLALAVLL